MIKWRYTHERDFTRDINTIHTARFGGTKKQQPLLGLHTYEKNGEALICADWDNVTPEQEEAIEFMFDDTAFLFKSPSGKIKAIFKVKLPSGTFLPHKAKIEALKDILPEGLHDVDPMGTERVFITESAAVELGSKLEALPLIEISDEVIQSYCFTTDRPDYKLIEYKGEIPRNLRSFIGIGRGSDTRESLIRILIGAWGLLESFDLPIKLLANQLDVSPALVSRLLKELQARNLLVCVDQSYIVGKKAKTYVAKHSLKLAIEQHKNSYKKTKSLPTKVIPGHFYQQMMPALAHFQTQEDFMLWLQSIDGIDYARLRKAERWARYEFSHLERREKRYA